MIPSARLNDEWLKLRTDVAAAEMISALEADRIPSILLKGPSIARWLYSEAESRPYGDVDLLVSPEDFDAAQSIAAGLGFKHHKQTTTRNLQESHHEVWLRQTDGVCLELHRSIYGVTVSDDAVWNELAAHTERLELGIGDVSVDVLAPAARACLLALHAAAHGRAAPKPIDDLERGIDRLDPGLWDQAAALAARLGATANFAIGLSLVPRGDEIVARSQVRGDASVEALLRAASAPPTAVGFAWLAEARGLRRKLGVLGSELFPPADLVRAMYPRAHRGRGSLLTAYALRPLLLMRQAPRGYRAYRKARREAEMAAGARRL